MSEKIIHKKNINSTNTFLKENYQAYDNYTTIYADHQLLGKGRISHTWYDEPRKNLLMSVLVKDQDLNKYLDQITLVVAGVIYQVLSEYLLDIKIKWPNDIYVNDKKICGILTEAVSIDDSVEAIIIGIGLNVNGFVYPLEIVHNVTSLYLLTNKKFSRKKILKRIIKILQSDIECLKQGDQKYLEIIKNNFYLQNKMINFEKNGIINDGIVLGIDLEGKLIVKTQNDIIHLYSGEVTLKK